MRLPYQAGEILADLVRETGGVGPAVGDLSVLADLQRVGAGGGEDEGPDRLAAVNTVMADPAGWLHARVAELEARNARLRQAAADRDELAAAQLASERAPADSLAVQVAALAAQVEELQRLLGKDFLLTEQRPVFPQLGRLAAVLGCTVTAHDRRAGAGPGGLFPIWLSADPKLNASAGLIASKTFSRASLISASLAPACVLGGRNGGPDGRGQVTSPLWRSDTALERSRYVHQCHWRQEPGPGKQPARQGRRGTHDG